jgi:methylphosphotriester-DNA--protein-cysteine methyltransferase
MVKKFLTVLFFVLSAVTAHAEVWGSAKSHIYHFRLCRWNAQIKPEYKVSFASPAAARKAGYYPCEKCRPPAAADRGPRKPAEKEPRSHNSY